MIYLGNLILQNEILRYKMNTSQHLSIFYIKVTLDMGSMSLDVNFLRHAATDIINFQIFNFPYFIRICRFDVFVIFTNFWNARKGSKFDCMNKKASFICAPRTLLQKLLITFYDQSSLIFWLSERDGLILDQCAPFSLLIRIPTTVYIEKIYSNDFELFLDQRLQNVKNMPQF